MKSPVPGIDFAVIATADPVADGCFDPSLPDGAAILNIVAGHAARQSGLPLAALEHYTKAAGAQPMDAEPLMLRAEVLSDLGRWAEAVDALRAADLLAPGQTHLILDLATALTKAGNPEDAIRYLNRHLALRPDCRRTRLALADCLNQAGQWDEACAHYAALEPLGALSVDDGAAYGGLLIKTGRLKEAVEVLQSWLRQAPDHLAARFHLGLALAEMADREAAIATFEACLRIDPEDPLGAALQMARLRDETPDQLSSAYVRTLFDQYADTFDAALLGRLGYRAPHKLADLIEAVAPDQGQRWDVLDLGCGTGLAGQVLRHRAGHLCGIDLSPAMIEKTRERGLHDELEVNDAVAGLASRVAAFDLVVAADVLVYMGDLAPLFAGVFAALRPGGLFAATVERADGDDWTLKPTRRFGHAQGYLQQAARAAGFVVERLIEASPRCEKGQPVAGFAFVLRRPS